MSQNKQNPEASLGLGPLGKQKQKAEGVAVTTAFIPSELPSVLRTSTELKPSATVASGLIISTASASKPLQKGQVPQVQHLKTSVLPQLPRQDDDGQAAAAAGWPTRPSRTMSPPGRRVSPRSDVLSKSTPTGAAAAGATRLTEGIRSSFETANRRSPGQLAAELTSTISPLPSTYTRRAAGGPDMKASALAQPLFGLRDPLAVAEDHKLSRPVDPSKQDYYWKPLPQEAIAFAQGLDPKKVELAHMNLLPVDQQPAPVAHARQRRTMLLRLPVGSELFKEAVPAVVEDQSGHPCLVVLPSDRPCPRQEALIVEQLLGYILDDPAAAVALACRWRANALATLSSESLGVLSDMLRKKGGDSWQFRQLGRNLTNRTLGADRAAAMEHLLNAGLDVHNVEKMSGLLAKNREASAAIAVAAEEAAAAAVAVASPAIALRSSPQQTSPPEPPLALAAAAGQPADGAGKGYSAQASSSSNTGTSVQRSSVPQNSDTSQVLEAQRAGPLSSRTSHPPRSPSPQQQQQQQYRQTLAPPALTYLIMEDHRTGAKSVYNPPKPSSPDMDLLWSPGPQKATAARRSCPGGMPQYLPPNTPAEGSAHASAGLQQLDLSGGTYISHPPGSATPENSVLSSHRGVSLSRDNALLAVPGEHSADTSSSSSNSSRSGRQLGDTPSASIRHHSAASSSSAAGPVSSRLKPSTAGSTSTVAAACTPQIGDAGQAADQVPGGHSGMHGSGFPGQALHEQQQQPHRATLQISSSNRHSSAPRSPSPSRLALPSQTGYVGAAVVPTAPDQTGKTAAAAASSHSAEAGKEDMAVDAGASCSSCPLGPKIQQSLGGGADRTRGSRLGSACSAAGEVWPFAACSSRTGSAVGRHSDSSRAAPCPLNSPHTAGGAPRSAAGADLSPRDALQVSGSMTGGPLESCKQLGCASASGIVFSRPSTPLKEMIFSTPGTPLREVHSAKSEFPRDSHNGNVHRASGMVGIYTSQSQRQQQQQEVASGQKCESQQQQKQQQDTPELSSLYGLSLGAAVCMADLIRQVEVHCADRGRVLAYVWNSVVGLAEESMAELRATNDRLMAAHGIIAKKNEDLLAEMRSLDFLRREAMRFRKGMEAAEAEASGYAQEIALLKERLEHMESEKTDLDTWLQKRLARLRWRNAVATLGTWSQESYIQSGCKGTGPGHTLTKVMMLEKLATAVLNVERRKMAYGRNKQPENFNANKPAMADMVKVMTQGPQVAAPGRIHDGYNIESTVQMLTNLTPEARTMVLATMPEAQRWKILEAMRDDERADTVIAAGLSLRASMKKNIDPRLWGRTMDVIKNHSSYGARYLTAMDIEDAAGEFSTWGTFQQVDCLAALDIHTAAVLLQRLNHEQRKEIVSMMEPYVAANIVQSMLPPPAADTVDSLDIKKALAVLLAMEPNKAAEMLVEMGAAAAAQKLVAMDPQARNCIIENMAPKAAAVTLVSMEDLVERQATEAGQELILAGHEYGTTGPDSPVMGAMMDMPAESAYNIMNYMTTQDKAQLLAAMNPDTVAKLLSCMEPNEAVVLLSALGDSSGLLVSQALSPDDRGRLIKIIETAGNTERRIKSAKSERGDSRQGTFRNRVDKEEVVQRLEAAYHVLEENMLSRAEAPEASEFSERTTRESDSEAAAEGSGLLLADGVGNGGRSKGGKEASRGRKKSQSLVSVEGEEGEEAVGEDAGALGEEQSQGASEQGQAAAQQARGPANNRSQHAPKAKKQPANAKRASDSGAQQAAAVATQLSKAADTAGAGADATWGGNVEIEQGMDSWGAEEAALAPAACAGAAEPSSLPAAAAGGKTVRRTRTSIVAAGAAKQGGKGSSMPAGRQSLVGGAAGGGRASVHGGAAIGGAGPGSGGSKERGDEQATGADRRGQEAVPALALGQLRRRTESPESQQQETTPMSSQRVKEEGSLGDMGSCSASMNGTPRNITGAAAAGGAAKKVAARTHNAATATGGAVAKQRALKDALRNQAVKKPGAGNPSACGGTAAGIDEDGSGNGEQSSLNTGAAVVVEQPQAKLGRLPKNARLIEAMAQHKNAKPKPKGWLMAVVDCIYKEGETLLRKLGRADMIKKQSVPEIVFAYFHNKYGQRALVNENVGSLVNTLTLYKRSDLRLEAFARLLSEEWDVSIFLDFLNAQSLCLQPLKITCIEYSREPAKDEQYAWVCLYKAVYVADSILGARTPAARDRFNSFLKQAASPAEEADVEKLRRDRREAASKGAVVEELPEQFWKLPRIRFLLILCKEILRINRYVQRVAEERFNALDLHHTGKVPITPVRSFVKQMSPGATDQQVADTITAFVVAAESAAKDIPAEQVAVASVTEMAREGFVAGVCGTASIREAIKANLLGPAPLDEEDAESQIFYNLLGMLTLRHQHALAGMWTGYINNLADLRIMPQLQQLAAAVGVAPSGDAGFKAYVALLLGLLNFVTQTVVDGALAPVSDSEQQPHEFMDPKLIEQQLCRLEDAVLLVVYQVPYLLDGDSGLAHARMARLPLSSHVSVRQRELAQYRHMRDAMQGSAAGVVQKFWRKHKASAATEQ